MENSEVQPVQPSQIERILSHRQTEKRSRKPKEISYKEKKAKESKEELWRMGIVAWKLDNNQMDLYDSYYGRNNDSELVWVVGRQLGKCISGDSKIPTLNGVKRMKDLQPGDYVYGYNHDGSITPTKILTKKYEGKLPVHEVRNKLGVIWASEDQMFNYYSKTDNDTFIGKLEERKNILVSARYLRKPTGTVNCPDAFYLGQYHLVSDPAVIKTWDHDSFWKWLAGVLETSVDITKTENVIRMTLNNLPERMAACLQEIFKYYFNEDLRFIKRNDVYSKEKNYRCTLRKKPFIYYLSNQCDKYIGNSFLNRKELGKYGEFEPEILNCYRKKP